MANNGCGGKNACGSPAPRTPAPIGTFDAAVASAAPAVVKSHAAAPVAQELYSANRTAAKGPYIALDPKYPGIVAGFMYDMANAKNLSAMGQTIMRRARDLTPGERELIFAYTSRLNGCEFCAQSHEACAAEFLDRDLVAQVVNDHNFGLITPKMEALLVVAGHVQALNRSALPQATENARQAGATDQEIHDAVLVASFACMCNRYVDGLGTQFKPGEPQEGGKGLAKYGYTMTLKRLFGEVIPTLWAKLTGKN